MSPVPTRACDVLVIGAGAAGCRAAIAAHEAGAAVVVVGKRRRRDAHTVLAAGGINAVLGTRDPDDTWEQHAADTFVEAGELADPAFVELLAREAPDAVRELAAWGCDFARTESGEIDQRYFGAHTWRRTCFVGDTTGRSILHTLADRVDALRIPVVEEEHVSRLLLDGDGRCAGALAFDLGSGERTAYLAGAVVLATGGHTRIWSRSSSRRDENTGDGMELAAVAGCRLADMELVQFHPTGMVRPEKVAGRLVTEAVRGEGGQLTNAAGERFMERYDPDRMELSTRDQVALAIFTEISEGRGTDHGGVWLDISHAGRDHVLERLPRIHHQFLEAQDLDITEEAMEVAPTAHYSMGGVVVDPPTGATGVPGLYAAGEVTAGLHGANRLGGNSLAETVVFGRRAGDAAAAEARGRGRPPVPTGALAAAADELDGLRMAGDGTVTDLQLELRTTMWEHCGVVRDHDRLQQGLERVGEVAGSISVSGSGAHPGRPTGLAHLLDLRASLVSAGATLRGAIERRESRGAHTRSDHPDTEPGLRVRFHVRRSPGGTMDVEPVPVPPVPDHLAPAIERQRDIEAHRGLVE